MICNSVNNQFVSTPAAQSPAQQEGSSSLKKKAFSFLARVKDSVEKALVPLKGLSLSMAVCKESAGLASYFVKFPKPFKNALSILKVPSIVANILSTALSIEEIHVNRKVWSAFSNSLQLYNKAKSEEDKSAALAKALAKIDDDGVKSLSKNFKFSRAGQEAMEQRVENLRRHIESKAVTAEDEKFIRILTKRAAVNMAEGVSDFACSVGEIAAGSVLLAPVPVAAEVAAASVFTACAVETLAVWTADKLFRNSNPFDPNSKCPFMSAVNKVTKGVNTAAQRIESLVMKSMNGRSTVCA